MRDGLLAQDEHALASIGRGLGHVEAFDAICDDALQPGLDDHDYLRFRGFDVLLQ